jgi:hypothetical protein
LPSTASAEPRRRSRVAETASADAFPRKRFGGALRYHRVPKSPLTRFQTHLERRVNEAALVTFASGQPLDLDLAILTLRGGG